MRVARVQKVLLFEEIVIIALEEICCSFRNFFLDPSAWTLRYPDLASLCSHSSFK